MLESLAVQSSLTLRKIPWFHLISWGGNFAERHSFRVVSGDLPKTLQKLCLSTKFPKQKIRWNYGVLRSVTFLVFDRVLKESLASMVFCRMFLLCKFSEKIPRSQNIWLKIMDFYETVYEIFRAGVFNIWYCWCLWDQSELSPRYVWKNLF